MEAVHIVGAGGIGCAVGYALTAAGSRVTFVDVNPRKIEAGRRGGVKLNDEPAKQAEFVHFDEWHPPADVPLILATKCYDNAAVVAKLEPAAQAKVVPIQNGFDAALDSLDHPTEGIASFVAKCEADVPHARITRPGDLHIGPRRGSTGFAFPQSKFFHVVPVPDIHPIKYAKLMYNAAISPLAAAAGIDNGQLLSVPAARRLFFELLQENYRILSAAGIALGKVGPFHPRTVAWILRRKWLAKLMARGFEPSLRGTYCSMAGEIEKGRTEIDNYNGHLVRLAEKTGTPCPLNRAVLALVTRMTEQREKPRLDVISEIR